MVNNIKTFYYDHITMQTEQSEIAISQKKKKREDFLMPTKENYSLLLSTNYTIKQLKEIAAQNNIKLSSTLVKADIVSKIYNYFKHYDNAVVIQKAWRRYLFKQYNKLRGPARFNRHICVNETDFFTMDDVKDIPYVQFFSFQDTDNMIYGCDLLSIYTLFQKGFDKTSNPYNRNILNKSIKKNMMKLIWLSRIFNDDLNVTLNEEDNTVQSLNTRILTLFHDIDMLGNYTEANWFLSLSQHALLRYITELNDIWMYRANLSEQVKREICPNHRDLFRIMYITDLRFVSLTVLQDIVVTIMETFVRDGINHDSRCLGTNFVLCALTLVSADAAVALPWLFQSVF